MTAMQTRVHMKRVPIETMEERVLMSKSRVRTAEAQPLVTVAITGVPVLSSTRVYTSSHQQI